MNDYTAYGHGKQYDIEKVHVGDVDGVYELGEK